MSSFQDHLRRLGFRTYEDYLASDRWRTTARLYKKLRCYCCGLERSLQVHHRSYQNLGREKADDLVTVCRSCHQRIHRLVDVGEVPLGNAHVVVRNERRQRQGKRK